MKILHVCLACFYIDNYGYQENILPKWHKLLGHDVQILASTEIFIDNKRIGYTNPSTYLNENGILVHRIPYFNVISKTITRKLRFYKGVDQILDEFNPDVIFLHNVQFCSINSFANYAKKNQVIIYADSHTDYINSCHGFFSKKILHGIVYSHCVRKITPYIKKYYGVLPARCDFLNSMYRIPKERIELLVMGVDDSLFNYEKKGEIRKKVRKTLGISDDAFVIISGGKIDKDKRIIELAKAVRALKNDNVVLIVFGSLDDNIRNEFMHIKDDYSFIYLDWISSSEVHKYYFAADLGVFPGTHSVLWEEAVGCGLPCVFKKWKGFDHINVNGNCVFIDDSDVSSVQRVLEEYCFTEKYNNLLINADSAKTSFWYSSIARKAIED